MSHNSSLVGGGIVIDAPNNHVLILNNIITNNKLISSVLNSEGGAGIFCYNSKDRIIIAENEISNNQVLKTSGGYTGYGGGICLKEANVQIRNNLIKNNRANYGGGISVDEFSSSDSPDFINNTIVKNEASYKGGGLYVNSYGVAPKMINSILWGNTATTDPQLNSRVFTEFSNIEGGFSGLGNIDLDPLFVDTVACCLRTKSPCVDAGNPDIKYNDSDGSRNDMGCYGGNGMDGPTDVKILNNLIPEKFILSQNYPNPFNPTTRIQYSILEKSLVTIKVYNILGKEVKTLVNENQNVGKYEISFNASDLCSGVYFYKLTAGNFVETKKMILLR